MAQSVLIFSCFALAIMVTLAFRYKRAELLHRERMVAMEKGVALPLFEAVRPAMDPVRRNLLFGMIWLFSGAGLAIFLFALTVTTPHMNLSPLSERQAKVDVLRKLGANDDELRRVIYDQERQGAPVPIGLGTVGFIPMGVGLAYLIFYMNERKRYPGFSPQ